MTIDTKRKILWWVKRILNYCEYADNKPYLIIEKGRVLDFRSKQCYHDIISEDQMKYFANMQLMSELEKNKIICYTKDVAAFNSNAIVYTAMLKVIVP